ncbi:MAG: amidohydrolase [Chloroflexi bacterium]|nr:amidohydrolase [Chloroflexota bacterium]
MKQGLRVVDTDLHLIEPFDLWEQRLEEPFRSRTKLTPGSQGHLKVTDYQFDIGGHQFSPSSPLVKSQSLRRWAEEPHLAEAHANCRPEVYLRGMDEEGIDLAVLVPTVSFLLTTLDGLEPDHALALCRVYNDWAAEFAAYAPERFKFWAWLPRQAPELAAPEAQRCVRQLGAAGVAMTSGAVDGLPLSHAGFEPLWQAIEELGVPLGIHLFGSARAMHDDISARRYDAHPGNDLTRATLNGFYHGLASLPELIFSGALERHPGLRPLIMEIGASWLLWLTWRMDEVWEKYAIDAPWAPPRAPGEYFRRQCFVSVDADEQPVRYLVEAGLGGNLVFTTDYPHHDCEYPEAVGGFLRLPGIPDDAKRAILADNAERLFATRPLAAGVGA